MWTRSALPALVLAFALTVAAAACDSAEAPDATPDRDPAPSATEASSEEPRPTRSYAMGFTPYPHDGAVSGLLDALELIEDHADLIAIHYDGGIPWNAALAGSPFPEAYRAEVEGKANVIPNGHAVYLAVTPISFERDGLAPDVATGSLAAPWDGFAFDHPDVIEAYGAFVLRMIELHEPDYLAYAIEPNLFADSRPDLWPGFRELAEATYQRIKAAHPDLPTFVSFQTEWFHRAPDAQSTLIADLLPYTDMIAVSAYPYLDGHAATAMPGAYFEALRALALDKPFAVAETGWPAEPVGSPYPVSISATEDDQSAFLDWVLADAAGADAEFVTWFLPRDLDGQWESGLSTSPIAATARIFRDNGLWAGDGTPRRALDRWQQELGR